jgi:hypothetical protein
VTRCKLTAEQRAAGGAKRAAERALREDRIAFRFAPRWAIGEDTRQWIIFERTGPNRYEPRHFYTNREAMLARMAEKPGIYDGVLAHLRDILNPHRGTGRWFHDREVFKPYADAAGLPKYPYGQGGENESGMGVEGGAAVRP